MRRLKLAFQHKSEYTEYTKILSPVIQSEKFLKPYACTFQLLSRFCSSLKDRTTGMMGALYFNIVDESCKTMW